MSTLRRLLPSFFCGLLFALGLVVSGMTSTANVVGFLDVRAWKPGLMLVMMGAILVFAPTYWFLTKKLTAPMFAKSFSKLPEQRLDARLLVGAALFGVGWGLGGYCPGPALVAAGSGAPQAILFTVAMLVGLAIPDWFAPRLAQATLGEPAKDASADE
jgi:uncharacterized protein